MAIDFVLAPGATPLDSDEVAGLIPSHISNHAQLNEWEMANILAGERWAFSRKRNNVLEVDFYLSVAQTHVRQYLALGRNVSDDGKKHRH